MLFNNFKDTSQYRPKTPCPSFEEMHSKYLPSHKKFPSNIPLSGLPQESSTKKNTFEKEYI